MTEAYTNKETQDIIQDVTNEFQKTDKMGYRDDQEIYEAWMNILSRYKHQILDSTLLNTGDSFMSNNLKQEALSFLNNKIKEFSKRYQDVLKEKTNLWACWFKDNEALIEQIAKEIDDVENKTLSLIENKIKIIYENNKKAEESKTSVGEDGQEVQKQAMFTVDKDGVLTFTSASNKPKIHEALQGLFDNDEIFEIDYSECTNPQMKDRLTKIIGRNKCYISYDKQKKTYLLRNQNGYPITSERAQIWEGVKLKRAATIKFEEDNRRIEAFNNFGTLQENWDLDPEQDPTLKTYTDLLPDELKWELRKLWNKAYQKFIVVTENRLNELCKKYKALKYELSASPISKNNWYHGRMEVSFTHAKHNYDETLFQVEDPRFGEYSKEIDKVIDKNETDYLQYLTKRINHQWNTLDNIINTRSIIDGVATTEEEDTTPTEQQETSTNPDIIQGKKKDQILYGMWLLAQTIDNFRDSEGYTWATNDDRLLVQMKQFINDAIYTISSSTSISESALKSKIIEPLWNLWYDYNPELVDGSQQNKENYRAQQKTFFENIILWKTKNDQIAANRWLAGNFCAHNTSFLAEEIAANEDEYEEAQESETTPRKKTVESLYLEDEALQNCLNNITESFKLSPYPDFEDNEDKNSQQSKLAEREQKNSTQIQNIKDLYKIAKGDTDWTKVLQKLSTLQIIPDSLKENDKIKSKTQEIAKSLAAQQ